MDREGRGHGRLRLCVALAALLLVFGSGFSVVRSTNFGGLDEWLIVSLTSQGIVDVPYANRPLELRASASRCSWVCPATLAGFLVVHEAVSAADGAGALHGRAEAGARVRTSGCSSRGRGTRLGAARSVPAQRGQLPAVQRRRAGRARRAAAPARVGGGRSCVDCRRRVRSRLRRRAHARGNVGASVPGRGRTSGGTRQPAAPPAVEYVRDLGVGDGGARRPGRRAASGLKVVSGLRACDSMPALPGCSRGSCSSWAGSSDPS